MAKKQNAPILGLVCVGGGAHGAYQVGVLKYIHEKFCIGDRSPFQIFTGCSCGSLNTSFFAAQSYNARTSRLELEQLWLNFHIPHYHGNMYRNAFRLFMKELRKPKSERYPTWSLLDPEPMVDVIKKGFVRANFERAISEGTTLALGVVATELVSGRCCWFTEGPNSISWNLFHSIGKIETIKTEHVAASCSVPIFLPPVKVGNRWFSDGSVNLTRPLSAAIDMGATRLLSIGTDKPYPEELPTYSPNFKPRVTNVLRMLLNRLSHDPAPNEATQIEVLNQFHRQLSKKTHQLAKTLLPLPLFHDEAMPAHYRPVEIYQIHPSKRLKPLSVDADYGHGEKVKRKSTRFMFHKKFIQELIDMGYQDAQRKHDDFESLFRPANESKSWIPFNNPFKKDPYKF